MKPRMKTLKPSTFVISITPFDKRGRIDEGAFRSHLRRLAKAGIGVYVGGGGSGEGFTLSKTEMARVLEIAVEELKGKVPVRAMGVEPRTAKQMLAFLKLAQSTGVDAAQIYSLDVGHGAAPLPEEMAAYFKDVLATTALPVVLSTHFSVGYKIPIPLMAELVQRHPHIIGINCTHPDLGYLAQVIACAGGRIPVPREAAREHLDCPRLVAMRVALPRGRLDDEREALRRRLVVRAVLATIDAGQRADTQPVAAGIDDGEAVDGALPFARSQNARDAGGGELAVRLPQAGSERAVQLIGVGDLDDHAAVGVSGIEPVHPEEVDADLAQLHDGGGVGTVLRYVRVNPSAS